MDRLAGPVFLARDGCNGETGQKVVAQGAEAEGGVIDVLLGNFEGILKEKGDKNGYGADEEDAGQKDGCTSVGLGEVEERIG